MTTMITDRDDRAMGENKEWSHLSYLKGIKIYLKRSGRTYLKGIHIYLKRSGRTYLKGICIYLKGAVAHR